MSDDIPKSRHWTEPFPRVNETAADDTLGLCYFCGGRLVRLGTASGWTRFCPTCPMPGPAAAGPSPPTEQEDET